MKHLWRRRAGARGEFGATTLEYGVMTFVLLVALTASVVLLLKA